jgi:hypothetical protein
VSSASCADPLCRLPDRTRMVISDAYGIELRPALLLEPGLKIL